MRKHRLFSAMNPKISFLVLLGLVALGYYAYDPELNTLHQLSGGRIGKPAPSKVKQTKPPAKKKNTVEAAAAAAEKPTAAPAAETTAAPAAAEKVVAAPAAEEQKAAADDSKAKLAPAGSARVGDVLATLPLVKEVSPNTNARYYIYLMSAGWCGPCNQEMPHIVKAYEEIRSMGVAEVILIDFDGKQEQALAYMDKYGACFPAIMQDKAPVLPGIQPPGGIPSAIIVDEMGNMVKRGHGSLIQQWKKHITEYEEKNGLPSSLESATPAPAAEKDKPAEKTKAKTTQRKSSKRSFH